jgi:hypothetical protein
MRRSVLVATILLSALASAASLNAQGTHGGIRGRVTGPGAIPLADVQVIAEGTGRLTVTDAEGAFLLERVPVGTHTLRFEAPSHRPAEYRDVRFVGGAVGWMVVELEAGSPASQATIRAAGTTLDPADVAARYALPGEVVSELPADWLDDVLAVLPGASYAESPYGPAFRGTHAGEAVVLVNGIPVRSTRTGAFLLHPGLTTLEEVQIVPGGSAEFGNAHGGLVNLVTRAGGSSIRGDLRYATDEPFGKSMSLGLNRVDGSVSGPLTGGVRFYLGGSLHGQLGAARGAGVDDVPAYVTAGVDTVVQYSGGGAVSLPRFARFNGACDAAENLDVACQGRRLPLEVGTAGSAVGRLDFAYGRGSLMFTTLLDVTQSRVWPGTLSFDPEAYQGVRTTGGVYALAWRHELNSGERRLAVEASLSYQTESRTAGSLDVGWELDHRSPTGGMLLSPMQFLVDLDRFSSDTGVYALRALESAESWDQLVENFHYDRGTRVPFIGRNELSTRAAPRANPWGASASFPLTGPAPSFANTEIARERQRWAKLALDAHPASAHRVRAGVEIQGAAVRRFAGRLISVAGSQAYTEDPSRVAAFATERFDGGALAIELGLRWERFSTGARYPVAPGRIFTNPAFDLNDPASLDSVFAPAAAHTALLPSIAAGFRLGAKTGVRLSYRRVAGMPALDAMMASVNSDLANNSSSEPFGRDVDWVKSEVLEAGLRRQLGRAVLVDLAGYRRQVLSGTAFRIEPIFDPFSDRIVNRTVLTNADTGTVYGLELTVRASGARWLSGQVSYSYQDADDVSAVIREHTLAGIVIVTAPADAGRGSWYGAVLSGLAATARFRLASGLPYTRLVNQGSGALAPGGQIVGSPSEPLDASRLPWIKEIDLRVVKEFAFGGVMWRAFADVRNLLGAENVFQLFAETGTTENDVYRESVFGYETLSLEQDAFASGARVDLGGGLWGADVTGDCSTWVGGGGAPACVALRRAEARWGNGDGVYDMNEFTTALTALYNLFYGRWTVLGPARQVRIGLEVKF